MGSSTGPSMSFWIFSAQLRTSCHSVAFYPLVLFLCHAYIFLGPLWRAVVMIHPHVPRFSSHQPSTWTPMPPFFLLFLCLPPTRIWELYKGRPTVFWVLFFPVFSTELTTEEVLKELLFHKKLTYEECNSLEAIWDAGRTKGKNFFQSLQPIWGIGF